MLLPARVKYRKVHRGRRTGVATQGNDLAFGEFGLQASEAAWMSNRQIEAARRVRTRVVCRRGEAGRGRRRDRRRDRRAHRSRRRSGSCCQRSEGRPGRRADHESRAGCRPQGGDRSEGGGGTGEAGKGWWEEMKMKDLQGLSMPDLQKKLKDSRQELFNLRFQMATGQLQNHRQIRHVRHDLAQILTEIHLKEFNGEPAAAPVEAAPKPRRPRAAAASEEVP